MAQALFVRILQTSGAKASGARLTKEQMAGEPQALARMLQASGAKLKKEQMVGDPQALQTAASANSRQSNLENRMELQRQELQTVADKVAREIASASDRMESIQKLATKDQAGEFLALIAAADKVFKDAMEQSWKIAESIEKAELKEENVSPGYHMTKDPATSCTMRTKPFKFSVTTKAESSATTKAEQQHHNESGEQRHNEVLKKHNGDWHVVDVKEDAHKD